MELLKGWDCLKILAELVKEEKLEAYLVGGALRDIFLGKNNVDLDIVLRKRVAEIARYFAEKIKGSFVTLDDKHKIYRVIGKDIFFDFTAMKGDSILEDLSRRDFTINAMAFPICSGDNFSGFLDLQKVIDPLGGLRDLKDKNQGNK